MKPSSEIHAIGGYSCCFTFDGQRLDVEWLPRVPAGELGRKLLPEYRRARDTFLRTLTPTFGNIMVVDL
jgi:hypothetical protein